MKRKPDIDDTVVVVVAGRYAGSVGFLDDWSERGLAIVYLDGATMLLDDPYVLIDQTNLILASPGAAVILSACTQFLEFGVISRSRDEL